MLNAARQEHLEKSFEQHATEAAAKAAEAVKASRSSQRSGTGSTQARSRTSSTLQTLGAQGAAPITQKEIAQRLIVAIRRVGGNELCAECGARSMPMLEIATWLLEILLDFIGRYNKGLLLVKN